MCRPRAVSKPATSGTAAATTASESGPRHPGAARRSRRRLAPARASRYRHDLARARGGRPRRFTSAKVIA